ncbi:MAG: AAA family ATPase [Pseudomonadales bacterium]
MSKGSTPIDLRKFQKDRHFFSGAGRAEILEELRVSLGTPEFKICVVSGPEGVGKTSLLQELHVDMRPQMKIISFSGHYGTIDKVLEHIAETLNITQDPEHTVEEMRAQIERHLSFNFKDRPLLVLFDDAHALPLPVIRELLAVLSAPGASHSVLFVDNEAVDVVCQFLQQQNVPSMSLRRMYREELAAYLAHHYHRAVSFTDLELDSIYTASEGVPLRVNQQAEYVLNKRKAASNCADNVTRISATTSLTWSQSDTGAWVAAACLTAAISVTSLYNALTPPSSALDAYAASEQIDLVDLSNIEEQDSIADEEFEVELPEEFVEFSDRLSDDEIDLLQTGSDQYVLQLMAGSSEEDMEAFVAEHAEHGVKMYRSLAHGEPWYKAVTEDFDNPKQAIDAAKALPSDLQQENPWVRTVASVQEEILTMGELHLSEKVLPNELERWMAVIDTTPLHLHDAI